MNVTFVWSSLVGVSGAGDAENLQIWERHRDRVGDVFGCARGGSAAKPPGQGARALRCHGVRLERLVRRRPCRRDQRRFELERSAGSRRPGFEWIGQPTLPSRFHGGGGGGIFWGAGVLYITFFL